MRVDGPRIEFAENGHDNTILCTRLPVAAIAVLLVTMT